MAVDFFYPAYEVVRNQDRCITCRVCERQCANKVHQYDAELGLMISDESACVNCQRCVSLCPTRALKIVKTDNTFKDNVNYTARRSQAACSCPRWAIPRRCLCTGISC